MSTSDIAAVAVVVGSAVVIEHITGETIEELGVRAAAIEAGMKIGHDIITTLTGKQYPPETAEAG